MKTILVTGASGYIGRHVLKCISRKNFRIIATDIRFEEKLDNIIYCECNIFDNQDTFKKYGQIDAVLHLAWQNGFVHNSDNHMKNLSMHYKFLTDMIKTGVQQICVMGSMHEVGYFEGMIDENTPTNPMSQYAIAKNALRQSMEIYCKDKNIIFQWIRAFYIYGDDQYGNSIFSKLQDCHKNGVQKFPFTSGKNKYDFISINELAKQITAVVTQQQINGIINCCSGKAVSLSEQVEWYIHEYKLDIQLEYGAFKEREYDSPIIWGDNTKIQKILSLQKEDEG